MLWLAALGCALVCLAAGLATAAAPRDSRTLLLTAVQLVGGAGLGWLVGWLLGLTPAEIAALVLIGAAPGTIAANPLVTLSGGDLTLAHGLTALGSFAAVLTVGAGAAWAGGSSAGLYLLILAAALPAFLGLTLRDRVPVAVHRLAPILAGLALAAMILAGLVWGRAGAAFSPLAGASLVLAVALAVLGRGAGVALGLGGPGTVTATLALPMRNIAVPMLAGFASGIPAAPLAAAIYGVVMYLPALALVIARALRR